MRLLNQRLRRYLTVMCGRFTQFYTWAEVHDFLSVHGPARNLQPRYNIAPTDNVDVVLDKAGDRVLEHMRWGLVPGWWKKPLKQVPATFNARRGAWRSPEGDSLSSCTMIVQSANPFMAAIHDRMPVFVNPEDVGGWLTGSVGLDALRPANSDLLQAWLVSRRVNKTGGADEAALAEPIAPPAPEGTVVAAM